jgi:hypothetical protein
MGISRRIISASGSGGRAPRAGGLTAPGLFDLVVVEVPALHELMTGRLKFVFGLANGELGCIFPKSEGDEKPPRLYGSKGVYGKVNSCWSGNGRLLHAALAELSRETKSAGSGK